MSHKPLTRPAIIFLISAFVLAVLFSVGFAYVITARVQFETRRQVEQAIPVQDMGWVRQDVDGMRVRIYGEAPTDESAFRVIEAVKKEINVNRIIDEITLPQADVKEPELTVEIVQNARMSSILGLLPKEPSPLPLYNALDRAHPDDPPLNLVENLEKPVDASWGDKINYLALIVDTLPNVQISASEEKVSVQTVVPDTETADAIKKKLEDAAPAGYQIELNISAPRPLITPFIFEEKTDPNGQQILACSATDENDLSKIRAAFPNLGEDAFSTCNLGLGAPADNWGPLVAEFVNNISDLKTHHLTIRDNQVKLDYSDQDDPSLVETASSRIRSTLPPGFGFESQKVVTIKSIDELQAEGNSVAFEIKKSADGKVSLKGVLGSEAMKANVESVAAAKFGSGEIVYEVQYVDSLPGNWEKHIFASINAVGELVDGDAVLSDSFFSIKGNAPSEATKTQVTDMLKTEMDGLSVSEEITASAVELVAQPTSDPNECVTRINDTLKANPIQFEPSSSKISDASAGTITAIAQILYECRGSSFEIGGYTDSKGSEAVNQRISEERAKAVLDAVNAQALEFGELTFKGYGENDPIATNDTEEGRALNRRIEIKLN